MAKATTKENGKTNTKNSPKATGKEEAKENAAIKGDTTTEMLLKRLEVMEKLLEEQRAERQEQAKKDRQYKRIITGLLSCLVIVLAVGMYSLNHTVTTVTKDLPYLITTATESMAGIQTVVEDVNSIDFEGLNNTISGMEEGIGAIDFETLNKSIEDLQKVVESLSNVTSIFR